MLTSCVCDFFAVILRRKCITMAISDYIEVHIEGQKGAEKLTPDNYDISELQVVLEAIGKLSPASGNDILSLRIEDGSVRQIFRGTKQRVAICATLLGLIAGNSYLEDVDTAVAEKVESIQKSAKHYGYTYTISTSVSPLQLQISPDTNYGRKEIEWVDGDFYLYGEVLLTGGIKPKLQLETKEYGRLTIAADKDFLIQAQNLLYHTCGMWVSGQQNVRTNEMNKANLKLIEMIRDYTPALDLAHLNHCIKKATAEWGGRAGYDEWYHLVKG